MKVTKKQMENLLKRMRGKKLGYKCDQYVVKINE